MAKTVQQASKKLTKENLFGLYFSAAQDALHTFETVFDLNGVVTQVFGEGSQEDMRSRVRASNAWGRISALYDYAIDGIESEHPIDIVLGGAEVIRLLDTEMGPLLSEFEEVCAMGDARSGLDEGDDIPLHKLSLLADVDPRTVRNAISAGELKAEKTEDGLIIDNASARKWLQGRRGFKATFSVTGTRITLEQIKNPGEFTSFLKARRSEIQVDEKFYELHPIEAANIDKIEQGIFALPINAVFPLADFYQLNRQYFLDCVMRVFFDEQLSVILDSHKG